MSLPLSMPVHEGPLGELPSNLTYTLADYFPGNHKLLSKVTEDGFVLPSQITSQYVLFYFSASWCGPCRNFTPILRDFYTAHHETKSFEIVLVTCDQKLNDFESYYAEMPWLAIPFTDSKQLDFLQGRFRNQFIPHLYLVETSTGAVVTDRARMKVQYEDPEGKEFPWPYPSVGPASAVDLTPTVIDVAVAAEQADSLGEKCSHTPAVDLARHPPVALAVLCCALFGAVLLLRLVLR